MIKKLKLHKSENTEISLETLHHNYRKGYILQLIVSKMLFSHFVCSKWRISKIIQKGLNSEELGS